MKYSYFVSYQALGSDGVKLHGRVDISRDTPIKTIEDVAGVENYLIGLRAELGTPVEWLILNNFFPLKSPSGAIQTLRIIAFTACFVFAIMFTYSSFYELVNIGFTNLFLVKLLVAFFSAVLAIMEYNELRD